MASTTISVARVLHLRVPIAWQEAVEVAHAADVAAAAQGTLITLEGCVLSAAGTVTLTPPNAGRGTSLSTVRLLGVLLEGATAPPELRALVDSEVDALSSFPSEHGGSAPKMLTLDWFVRPNPESTIARLAARGLAAEAAAHAPAPAPSAIQQFRSEVAESPAPPTPTSPIVWLQELSPAVLLQELLPSGRSRLVAAAGAATVVMAVTTWAWLPARDAVPVIRARGLAMASAAVVPFAPSARAMPAHEPAVSLETVTPRAMVPELRSPSPAASAIATSSVPASVALSSTPAANTGSAVGPAPSMTSMSAPAAPPTVTPPFRKEPNAPLAPVAPATAVPGRLDAASMDPPPADRRVYSAQDEGVEPPTMIRPQMPSEPKPDAENSNSYVEVVVDERGQVASVRLRSTDLSLNDRMIVSAAKAWQFQPALKDGHPVKYVLRLPVTR